MAMSGPDFIQIRCFTPKINIICINAKLGTNVCESFDAKTAKFVILY